jgi:hypothetical protein
MGASSVLVSLLPLLVAFGIWVGMRVTKDFGIFLVFDGVGELLLGRYHSELAFSDAHFKVAADRTGKRHCHRT